MSEPQDFHESDKNSYLFLIFLRHSYNLNFREDIQSDEATGGWNRVILSDFSWRVASIQESFQTSLVWPCADSADCTWDKHRLAVTSRQERHRDMCVDEFNKNNLTTEEKQRQILGSPKLNKPNREVVVLSCTLLYYIWSILHCIGIFGNHWNIELQTYLASMASMASGCASRSAWHRGLKELAEDKIQDLQTRMRAPKNLSQNL